MVDVYPQLVIGGVQTIPNATRAQHYPTLADIVSPAPALAVPLSTPPASPPPTSPLLNDLQTLRANGASLEGLRNAARPAIASRALATEAGQLAASFPEIDRIAALLDAHKLDEAASALRTVFANWRDLQGKAVQLHDAMLASLVLNENHLLIETAHRFLKIFWLLKVLGEDTARRTNTSLHPGPSSDQVLSEPRAEDGAGTQTDFIKRFWATGAVSVPLELPPPQQGVWPTKGYLEQEFETSAPSDRPTAQALSAEIAVLQTAKTELKRQHQEQLTAQKYAKPSLADFVSQQQVAPRTAAASAPAVGARVAQPQTESVEQVPTTDRPTQKPGASHARPKSIDLAAEFARYTNAIDSNFLSKGSYDRLSAPTRAMLAALGHSDKNLVVAGAYDAIDNRIATLYSSWARDATQAWVPVVQFGGFLVEAHPSVLAEICGVPKKQCHCDLLKQLARKHGEKPQVHVLGTGRAYRVSQELNRYVRGELVHTEPVLGGTTRSMSFRQLNRVEEVQDTITARETFEEKEATTHDQFAFATEVAKQAQQQQAEQYGVSVSGSVSGSYGTTSMSASASATYSGSSATASSQAEHTARSNAQEVIDRAIKRIQEKVEERRSITRITETERKNGFELDNKAKPSFTGFYYAVNKEYKNQLVFVGERLMIRVAIQQPMAFLIHCMSTIRSEAVTLAKPIPPGQLGDPMLGSLKSFQDINAGNYAAWASLYEAQGIKPPPSDIVVSHGVAVDYTPGMKTWMAGKSEIEIPAGYKAAAVVVRCLYPGGVSEGWTRALLGVVGSGFFIQYGPNYSAFPLDGEQGKLAVTYWGHVPEFSINYVVTCSPAPETIDQWRIDAFSAIMDAYNRRKSEYDNQVNVAGITIQGRNPLKNKMLVEQELQKFVLGAVYPPFYYRGFDSMKFGYKCDDKGNPVGGALPVPEPDFKDANEESPWVTFFLQMFEWKNMTYKFLPYHFGHRRDWYMLRQLEDVDQFFENAITAGYVVVDIPVAPQMTEAFLHFHETQQIWKGGDMPVFGNPMFQEIAIAIRDSENMADGEPVGDPWTTLVPTPLVFVQDNVPGDL